MTTRSCRFLRPVRVGLLLLLLPAPRVLGAQDATQPAKGQRDRTEVDVPRQDPRAWRSDLKPMSLSLDEALDLAIANNLQLTATEEDTEISRLNAVGSWGAFDPVVSARGGLTDSQREGQSSLSGATVLNEDTQTLSAGLDWPFPTGTEVSLSYARTNDRTNNQFATFDVSTTDVVTAMVTQPLLRGAWTRFATTQQRTAELAHLKQREVERQVRQGLELDVYNAYWDLVSARDQLDVRIVTYELGQEQLRQDRRRLDVGAGTEVDVLQSETNVAQAWEALLQAANGVLAAEDALRSLLFQQPGKDVQQYLASWDVPIQPTTPLPDVDPGDVPTLGKQGPDPSIWRHSLDAALTSRPELAQALYDVQTAEVALQRSRSDRRAQLDLELSAQAVGFDSDPSAAFREATGFDFPQYTGALVLSLPLGNRTARYAERAARAGVRNARLRYDIQELDVLAEVRAAVREQRYRAISAMAAGTSLELARRQLAAEQARQRNGLSTTFQVLQFQQTLSEALSAERAARAAYAKAIASLRHAEGVLDQPAATPEGAQEGQGGGGGNG